MLCLIAQKLMPVAMALLLLFYAVTRIKRVTSIRFSLNVIEEGGIELEVLLKTHRFGLQQYDVLSAPFQQSES